MKIVLDTNAYSDYAEGLPEIVDLLASQSKEIYLPSIVLGELYFGFLNGSRQRFNENKLKQFIKLPDVHIINLNSDIARKYGVIYLSLHKKGIKIPINDVWISACCMDVGGVLLTRDKHFIAVEQIETIIIGADTH